MDDEERQRLDEKFEGIKPLFGDPEYSRWAASKKKHMSPKKVMEEAKKQVREELEAGKVTVADLLGSIGYEDDAPVELRLLAEKAIAGKTTDIKLFLQQTKQLRAQPKAAPVKEMDGRCPHCGETLGNGPETLVLSETAMEALASARIMALEGALAETSPDHALLRGTLA